MTKYITGPELNFNSKFINTIAIKTLKKKPNINNIRF